MSLPGRIGVFLRRYAYYIRAGVPVKSVGQQLEKLITLCGTKDVNRWEETFIRGMWAAYLRANESTGGMTGPMVEKIEQIYRKHFE